MWWGLRCGGLWPGVRWGSAGVVGGEVWGAVFGGRVWLSSCTLHPAPYTSHPEPWTLHLTP